MFYNSQQNSQKVNVNTNYDTFFGELSYLQVGGWNDKMSFKWVPTGEPTANGRRTYDKDRTVSTGVTHGKIEALLAKYEAVIRPKLINSEDPGENGLCVGIVVTSGSGDSRSNSLVFIEYRRGSDGNGYDVFFGIGKNLTQSGIGDIIRYKFDKNPVITGTSPEKGGFEEGQLSGEFLWFITLLKAHGNIARYGDHSKRYADAYSGRDSGGSGNNGGYSGSNDFMNVQENTDGFSVFQ